MTRLIALLRFAIFLGPLAFLSGMILLLAGNVSSRPDTVFFGLCLAAAGLIVWGCHGLRRRGKRPGFMLMIGLGSSFLLLHLQYRLSDYRWLQINSMTLGSPPAATAHLESRITLLLCILIASVVLGLLPPLPQPVSLPSRPLNR